MQSPCCSAAAASSACCRPAKKARCRRAPRKPASLRPATTPSASGTSARRDHVAAACLRPRSTIAGCHGRSRCISPAIELPSGDHVGDTIYSLAIRIGAPPTVGLHPDRSPADRSRSARTRTGCRPARRRGAPDRSSCPAENRAPSPSAGRSPPSHCAPRSPTLRDGPSHRAIGLPAGDHEGEYIFRLLASSVRGGPPSSGSSIRSKSSVTLVNTSRRPSGASDGAFLCRRARRQLAHLLALQIGEPQRRLPARRWRRRAPRAGCPASSLRAARS